MQAVPTGTGWIEVIAGPMFSGKTEELIRRLRRSMYAKQRVAIFKPTIDTRYDAIEIVSHSKQSIKATPVDDVKAILDPEHKDCEVVGIDEAQFFSRDLVSVCQELADRGVRVIVAGLDMDYRGFPFEPMPQLMAVAEFVTKALSICVVCGNPAGRSQRIVRESERVMLGATESYEPRCRLHHTVSDVVLPEQSRLF
ncbi:MAG: thymidine kinase [Myxococcota bacterium]|nr:thymidine kinase [Myxococcota bacterium]